MFDAILQRAHKAPTAKRLRRIIQIAQVEYYNTIPLNNGHRDANMMTEYNLSFQPLCAGVRNEKVLQMLISFENINRRQFALLIQLKCLK